MRTIRIVLLGGRHDGTPLHIDAKALRVSVIGKDESQSHYRRAEMRDRENRQIFMLEHNRTLSGLKPCDLG